MSQIWDYITMSNEASSKKLANNRKRKHNLSYELVSCGNGVGDRDVMVDFSNPEHKQKKSRLLNRNGNTDQHNVLTDIRIEAFAENRSVEIQALTDVVKNVGGNHMAFQKLPRHMRRRAMSHNIKRVPRRLHTAVKSELEKTKAPGKRPSRRYRRRPSNLLKEYERRRRKIGWLETHIWHAKRFKMADKWGYRLAVHPNDKSVRACYRAVSRHCLMQDVSYESYIEVKGPRQEIMRALSHLTSERTGPTFASGMTAKGTRQGTLMLYHFDSYPHNAIGQVTFLWKPKLNDDDHPGDSVLWICCHPSFHTEALREIESCLKSVSRNQGLVVTGGETEIQQKDQFSKVSVTSLKDQLVKFRLYGPASNRVLSETLQLANLNGEKENHSSDKEKAVRGAASVSTQEMFSTEMVDEQTEPWWKKFYLSNCNLKTFKEQTDVWLQLAHCQSPAEAPANCILGLSVRDPRVLLPPKKNKVSIYNGMSSGYQTLSSELFTAGIGSSPLWEAEIREEVKTTKISEQKLNGIKSKQLVPGTPLQLGDNESRIPVLLIQRPGTHFSSLSSENGYGSGWDVLIPSGWAMPFWIALVYRGARVGGIREARSIAQHAGLLSPTFDFPDTVSGKEEMKSESKTLQAKHDCRPPAKRPNYTKLGFPSAFAFQFGKLVKEWIGKWADSKHDLQGSCLGLTEIQIAQANNSFSVLRDKKMLKLLDCALNGKQVLSSKARNSKKAGNLKSKDALAQIVSCDLGKEMIEKHAAAIVAVALKFPHRGVPSMFGHICQPSKKDLKEISRDKNFGGPFEIKHKDTEEGKRKEERKERLRQRRRKRRGKREKKECVSESSDNQKTEKLENSDEEVEMVSDSTKEDTKLSSEDSSCLKLLSHTSRPIIGFVHNGDFDLVRGQGSGIGFCSVAALLLMLAQKDELKNTMVLVRNPTSLQYRFSSMSIII